MLSEVRRRSRRTRSKDAYLEGFSHADVTSLTARFTRRVLNTGVWSKSSCNPKKRKYFARCVMVMVVIGRSFWPRAGAAGNSNRR
jgi:hypothetical protein